MIWDLQRVRQEQCSRWMHPQNAIALSRKNTGDVSSARPLAFILREGGLPESKKDIRRKGMHQPRGFNVEISREQKQVLVFCSLFVAVVPCCGRSRMGCPIWPQLLMHQDAFPNLRLAVCILSIASNASVALVLRWHSSLSLDWWQEASSPSRCFPPHLPRIWSWRKHNWQLSS